MPINYSLQPNKTKGAKPGEYRAVVKPVDTLYLDDLVKKLNERHNNISSITANMVLGAFFETVEESLHDGYQICTPVFNVKTGVKGKFTGPEDQFFSNRHQVTYNCSSNRSLNKKASRQRAYKVQPNDRLPVIKTVHDMKLDSKNNQITIGGLVEIKGLRLGMDPENKDEFIALKNNGQVHRITQVFPRSDNHLMMIIPEGLPLGEYQLMIQTRVRNTSELRAGYFSKSLSLVAAQPMD